MESKIQNHLENELHCAATSGFCLGRLQRPSLREIMAEFWAPSAPNTCCASFAPSAFLMIRKPRGSEEPLHVLSTLLTITAREKTAPLAGGPTTTPDRLRRTKTVVFFLGAFTNSPNNRRIKMTGPNRTATPAKKTAGEMGNKAHKSTRRPPVKEKTKKS